LAFHKCVIEGNETEVYYDDKLNEQIDKYAIPDVRKKDNDGVYVVDGPEGSGKSVFGMQLAKKFDPNFSLERVCFTPTEFTRAIIRAKKGQCVVFDEAFTGLSSRGSLTEVNKLLVSLMMEMRQKNLFVIIIMPTFFLLDKYVALWRARGLFHIYTKNRKRGYWMYFNRKTKKLLYLLGKKFYDYSKPKSNIRGRFFNKYIINEEEYRIKKKEAMQNKSRATRAQVFKAQRDTLFYALSDRFKLNNAQIMRLCARYGFKIDRSTISEILTDLRKQMILEEELEAEKASS
jgi:hypothetical protein